MKDLAQKENDSQKLTPPLQVRCSLVNGRIEYDVPLETLRRSVEEGRIVVLKGVFSADQALRFRNALMQWGQATAPFPHGLSPSTQPDVNYHRIDDGSVASACPHVFHQFGINNFTTLNGDVGEHTVAIAESLRRIQNEIAETTFEFSLTGLRLKVLHYPAGGGFLTAHTHPRQPQGIGLVMSLSRMGTDVSSGAVCFETPNGRVDTTHYHDLGDVVIFRYDLPHEVTPVEPEKSLDWNSPAGKWSVVLELRETHGRSHGQQGRTAA